jgi:hypothetical protein
VNDFHYGLWLAQSLFEQTYAFDEVLPSGATIFALFEQADFFDLWVFFGRNQQGVIRNGIRKLSPGG